MVDISTPLQNHLLNTLPADEYKHLFPDLELVSLPLGKILYEPGDKQRYAYFLTNSIVSLLYATESGSSTEIAVVGNEGVVGIAFFMGDGSMLNRATVQSAGNAYQIPGSLLKQKIDMCDSLLPLLLRYTQSLITQISQTAVCNRHHSVDQQLCRWLLLILDRLEGSDLFMTQELIANMLGVRREGVTEAAGNIQRAGLIHYQRGHIAVLDRSGLESRVCECYHVVKKEYDRLLNFPQP